MDESFASNRGGAFTYLSDKRALLNAPKLVSTLPTFLTDCLLRSDCEATVKLFPHNWIGVVVDGNLFLWRFSLSKDNTVATTSSCRQFELPSVSEATATSASMSCFGLDGRPRLCAAVAAGILRVWPRGVFGVVGRSQIVYDCIDTQLSSFRNDEACVALEEGPCSGTFLLATSHGRIFGVDSRTPQEQVYTFLVSDGVTNIPPVSSAAVNTSVHQTSMSENAANNGLLSGLSRRVSSIWSYAASKVPNLNVSSLVPSVGSSATGKVLRFLVVATPHNTCRMLLLTQSHLTIWDLDADFEHSVTFSLALNNDTFGEAVDMTLSSPSSCSTLWLLCKSVVEEEDALSLVLFDIESTPPGGNELNSRVSIKVDTNAKDFKLINSIPGASVYPCTLLALFSAEARAVYIVEALTGCSVCQIESERPSQLLGVVSAPSDSNALFALITRQHGIYGIVGGDPCLPSIACLQLTSDCLSSPDRLLEGLVKIGAILWMGYEEEANVLIKSLFGKPNRVKNDALLTAFLRLTNCVLNSRPTSGPDARWRGVNNTGITAFDFACGCGDSRFVAKQESMQRLGGRFWPAVMAATPEISGATDAALLFTELFPPLLSSTVGTTGSRCHILNAFLAGAEVCETARILHSRLCRLKQNALLKPVFKASVDAAVVVGVVDKSTFSNNLLSPEDIFFQTMTLVPHFITNLAEELVLHARTCLNEDMDSVDFVACAAQLLTLSLTEALEYRQKLLPALETVLSEVGNADSVSKYDLFCWITENDVMFNQLQEAFDSLVELAVALKNESDRMLTEGGSLRQECACRSVELATILLQAVYQRVQWCGSSCPSELDACFVQLRTHVISAVAWSIDRLEAGLDLAIRFVDKALMLEISERLDKAAATSGAKPHANLMIALARSNPDIQLADYALQWYYSNGEKSRLQSLLAALQEKESGSNEVLAAVQTEQKRLRTSISPSRVRDPIAKRFKSVASPVVTATIDSSVNRFLQRSEVRDFAWLHQLGNWDFEQASKGLLAAGENEIHSLGRRRTLLSLSKLAGIASGQCKPSATAISEAPNSQMSESETPLVDKYLEVIQCHEELIRRGQLKSDSVFPSHILAPQFIANISKADSAQVREELLMNFSIALRLAQLYTELNEDHFNSDARRENQEKLLTRIWAQAVKVDSLNKKPGGGGEEFNGACEDSFFYALLEHCLLSGRA
ncbi:hypothetical protein Aperf_G00000051337 [Anoplocephala perfoliata]